MDSDARLRLVARAAGLAIDEPPLALPSESNDAWKVGELVLRVCWRGDRTRVRREAVILEHLPEEVPHVRLADAGVADDLTWTLTRWVPGTRVSDVWRDLGPAERRVVGEHLGQAFHALHEWEPSPAIRAAIAGRPAQPGTEEAAGADLNPLPVDRARRLVEPASRLANIDPQLVLQLGEEIERLRSIDPLEDPTEGVVVHGDAHLDNVVWHDGRIVTVLDYEWARLGPPDLELQPLLALGDAPGLIRSILDAYPGIASHERFVERLWLYDLAATLRDLLVKAPLPETDDLPPGHPKRVLPRILAGPSYIEAKLSGR